MKQRYATNFCLTGSVNDWSAAQDYLDEDDMTQYVPIDIKPLLIHIGWELVHNDSGYIVVDAKEELSDDVLKRLSRWISGQNSDGLGEGFEQQDFAWETELEPGDEDYNPNEGWMCSFDWDTNDYNLVKVEDMDSIARQDLESYIGKLV